MNALRAELADARQELAAALEETAAARQETAQVRAEEAVLRNSLAEWKWLPRALHNSTPWRITGALRRVVRLLRRQAQAPTCSDVSGYGAVTGPAEDIQRSITSNQCPEPLHAMLGSAAIARRRLATVAPRRDIPQSAGTPRFSIVTRYSGEPASFRDCAASVATLFAADDIKQGKSRLEWIVVNDDPNRTGEPVQAAIASSMAAHVRILSEVWNDCIAAALNRGIRAARNDWIVVLDDDATLEAHALEVLDREIGERLNCRCFIARIIDIGEAGRKMRRYRQSQPPEPLFEAGMESCSLMVFRRDLFDELNGFDVRFAGMQGYDFALRAAAREPFHSVAQHLHRRHSCPQNRPVADAVRQDRLADAVRASFLRRFLVDPQFAPLISEPLPERIRGFCAIRTQGARMELLEVAIASVQAQSIPITACVAVHGPAETRAFVEQQLRRRGSFDHLSPPIVVAASAPARRRGYPCNVALDVLRTRLNEFDVFCFLDDDDRLLPNFASTLLDQIRYGQADMAFGLTNALPATGEPLLQHNLLPAVSLFHNNFMPINSYLCRTQVILAARASFDEELDYLEDWDFLLQLMAAGIKAVPAFATVAEYSLIGDGNAPEKRDPEHFDHCLATIRERGRRAASCLPQSRFWNDVMNFPSDRRLPYSDLEIANLKATLDLFALPELI